MHGCCKVLQNEKNIYIYLKNLIQKTFLISFSTYNVCKGFQRVVGNEYLLKGDYLHDVTVYIPTADLVQNW